MGGGGEGRWGSKEGIRTEGEGRKKGEGGKVGRLREGGRGRERGEGEKEKEREREGGGGGGEHVFVGLVPPGCRCGPTGILFN